MQDTSKYLFTSERLGFRFWNSKDLNFLHELCKDEEVMKHFPSSLSIEESQDFLNRLIAHQDKYGYCYFAVETLNTQDFVGFIGFAYQTYETEFAPGIDIGWRLVQSAWGKGYATEGAKKCLDFGKNQLSIDEVFATCTKQNTPSENVMQKIGMTKQYEFDHPRLSDFPEYKKCIWYSLQL